ncbi:hypothetical protein KFK09_021911 [Dendrobium nobile]|uniref:Uncharacterized protein n=1 Tax=Dendrobium nobile TaxID=94219 RepID=A0A8T3AH96_DENNO|nr:hypothetical protein KFK09_021911 [Dendrobium nobile]
MLIRLMLEGRPIHLQKGNRQFMPRLLHWGTLLTTLLITPNKFQSRLKNEAMDSGKDVVLHCAAVAWWICAFETGRRSAILG